MTNEKLPLHLIDYVIFLITIFISLGIGVYHAATGGKQRTTSEFFVGDRKMSVLPVALSMMVTFESSILMIGTPAEVYVYGIQIIIETFGWFISYVLTLGMVVALIHPLKLTSAYEYLERRFKSKYVRILGTLIGILYYVAYLGIVLFGPAIALEAVSGVPLWLSIIEVAGTAVVYTTIGGFKAVVWADVFQTLIMFIGVAAVLIKGTMRIGGIGKSWSIAQNKHRLNFFDFRSDPTLRHTFWCLSINGFFRSFGLLVNQSSVQRISSMPTQSAARKVLIITAPAFSVTLCLACVEGIVAYSYFDVKGCDPLESGEIRDPNQIIPYMVTDLFQEQVGMSGLFLASLFSASLSTLSSGLSSLSVLVLEDLIKPFTQPMSEFRATLIAKATVVCFGIVAVVIAFLTSLIGGTLVQIAVSILASFHGPLAGMFMFGAFCPWASSKGAFGGTIIGVILTLWICIGQMTTDGSVSSSELPPAPTDLCMIPNFTIPRFNHTYSSVTPVSTTDILNGYSTSFAKDASSPEISGVQHMYTMSYQWFSTVGIASVFICGSIISIFTGINKPQEGDHIYFISVFDHLFWYLPESVLKYLRCGINYQNGKRIIKEGQEHEMIMQDSVS
ncbi:sodium-dependent multivitamin transporter-like [Ruditapes philippinarum]|uniref:sodium-dependent multivitamin transporter-like n=1 Tax=Ruditapes philippinarum TaxID=129788 RepID=UPI00295AA267|nr:sodium-dependent multivitamin transporter-like [Ruditapes philippinarum]